MNSKMSSETDFLFARPSFMSGFARVIDLGGGFDAYNSADSEVEADERAIACDWRVVGGDLATAIHAEQAKAK